MENSQGLKNRLTDLGTGIILFISCWVFPIDK